MKSSLTCVAMLLALTAFATTARAADEDQGIKDRLAEFAAAWNQHDPKALAAVWAEDGDLINPAGRHAKGRQEVEQLFSDEQEGIFKGTSFQITVESVRMLPGDIALVDANWKITAAPGAGQQPPMPDGHVFMVMHRESGKWMVVSGRPYRFASGPPRER